MSLVVICGFYRLVALQRPWSHAALGSCVAGRCTSPCCRYCCIPRAEAGWLLVLVALPVHRSICRSHVGDRSQGEEGEAVGLHWQKKPHLCLQRSVRRILHGSS